MREVNDSESPLGFNGQFGDCPPPSWERWWDGPRRQLAWKWTCQPCRMLMDVRWGEIETLHCPCCGRIWQRVAGSLWELYEPDSRLELLRVG